MLHNVRIQTMHAHTERGVASSESTPHTTHTLFRQSILYILGAHINYIHREFCCMACGVHVCTEL